MRRVIRRSAEEKSERKNAVFGDAGDGISLVFLMESVGRIVVTNMAN